MATRHAGMEELESKANEVITTIHKLYPEGTVPVDFVERLLRAFVGEVSSLAANTDSVFIKTLRQGSTVRDLAKRFDVSEEAVRVRIARLRKQGATVEVKGDGQNREFRLIQTDNQPGQH